MLEFIILGFLSYHTMSGYEIKQKIALSTANFYDASFGSIYPALKRLESRGNVCASEVVEGNKYKKYYEITETGKAVFRKWLEQPVGVSGAKQEHLVKMFFFGYLPKEQVIELLTEFIKNVEATSQELVRLEETIQGVAGFYPMATLDYGKAFYRFLTGWCTELLEKIKSGKDENFTVEGGVRNEDSGFERKS